MLRVVALTLIAVTMGLVAGFFVVAEVNARTPSALAAAGTMLITAFGVASETTWAGAGLLRASAVRRWTQTSGAATVNSVILFAAVTVVVDALQPHPPTVSRVILDALEENSHGIDPQEGDRDAAMAENGSALVARADSSRTIISAANSHVRGAHDAMGQHLKAQFDDNVYLLGGSVRISV